MSCKPRQETLGMTEAQKGRWRLLNRAFCECGNKATVRASGNGGLICERCHKLEGEQSNHATCGHGTASDQVYRLNLPK